MPTMTVKVNGKEEERDCTVSYRELKTLSGTHQLEKRTPIVYPGEHAFQTISGWEIVTR
jgi:hypothetical protein